jgi:polysaccharide export outer membrane protein
MLFSGFQPDKMNRILIRVVLGLAAAAVVRPALAQEAAKASPAQEYVQPGDVVKLWVWREEELSGEFLVPENGMVVFPKIGVQKVTEVPMPALRDALLAEFQKYLRNPSIEVSFLRRVNILGAVRKPGVYTLDPTMTVAMALAMAEGTTSDGRPDRVELHRDGQKLIADIKQRTRIGELPIRSGDQLYVPERSWVLRNTGLVATAISGVFGLLSLLMALNN